VPVGAGVNAARRCDLLPESFEAAYEVVAAAAGRRRSVAVAPEYEEGGGTTDEREDRPGAKDQPETRPATRRRGSWICTDRSASIRQLLHPRYLRTALNGYAHRAGRTVSPSARTPVGRPDPDRRVTR